MSTRISATIKSNENNAYQCIGFALKKIFKFMLIIVGFLAGTFFVGVRLLQKHGYVSTGLSTLIGVVFRTTTTLTRIPNLLPEQTNPIIWMNTNASHMELGKVSRGLPSGSTSICINSSDVQQTNARWRPDTQRCSCENIQWSCSSAWF